MSRLRHVVTGEYPPHGRGVAAHAAQVAAGLAAAGEEVHVWTRAAAGAPPVDGVTVHGVGGFGAEGLRRLSAGMDAVGGGRMLVEYVPQAFGRRGIAPSFARWVRERARGGSPVDVLFHEPYVPRMAGRPLHNLLAAPTHAMARDLLSACRAAYLSTASWEPLLRPLSPPGLRFRVLPIPSTIPVLHDPAAAAAVRERVLRGGREGAVLGHFGTYGAVVSALLEPVLAAALERAPGAVALLLGEGGAEAAADLARRRPALAPRLVAPGRLADAELSLHLQACDAAVQPYADGVTTRRTTLAACLAHGVPVAAYRGEHTEALWASSPLSLVPVGDADALGAAAAGLLQTEGAEGRRAAARAFHDRHLALERTLEALMEPAGVS